MPKNRPDQWTEINADMLSDMLRVSDPEGDDKAIEDFLRTTPPSERKAFEEMTRYGVKVKRLAIKLIEDLNQWEELSKDLADYEQVSVLCCAEDELLWEQEKGLDVAEKIAELKQIQELYLPKGVLVGMQMQRTAIKVLTWWNNREKAKAA